MPVAASPTSNSKQNDVCDRSSTHHGWPGYQAGCQVSDRYLFPPRQRDRPSHCQSTWHRCMRRGIAILSTAVASHLFASSCKLTEQLSVFGQTQEELSCPRMIMRRPETALAVARWQECWW